MKISPKLFLLGCFIGLGLFLGIIQFLPDGKLHIVFCGVGQGDAIYLKFPNGVDMLVDGGPNKAVLSCLGSHMPFYDRKVNFVVLTHPQKDHLEGLISVLKRYTIDYFAGVPVKNNSEDYAQLVELIKKKELSVLYLTYGYKLVFDSVEVSVLWPEKGWLINSFTNDKDLVTSSLNTNKPKQILGFDTNLDLNEYSLYLHVKMNSFDLLLTGDGDIKTQADLWRLHRETTLPNRVEVLKIPHHGSKTAMSDDFINLVRPKLSIIQVGKNSYGHPDQGMIDKLSNWGSVLRTDQNGDIEVITDGLKLKVLK